VPFANSLLTGNKVPGCVRRFTLSAETVAEYGTNSPAVPVAVIVARGMDGIDVAKAGVNVGIGVNDKGGDATGEVARFDVPLQANINNMIVSKPGSNEYLCMCILDHTLFLNLAMAMWQTLAAALPFL
jgi:hypothetical protein